MLMWWRDLNGRINTENINTVWLILNYTSRLQPVCPKLTWLLFACSAAFTSLFSGPSGGKQSRVPCCVFITISRRMFAFVMNSSFRTEHFSFHVHWPLYQSSFLGREMLIWHVCDLPGRGQTRGAKYYFTSAQMSVYKSYNIIISLTLFTFSTIKCNAMT